MGNVQRVIAGVRVEVQETAGDKFRVVADGRYLVMLTYTRDEGHGRWLCACKHASGKRDPMLAHVIAEHATLPPLLTADRGRTFEAMNTYLRMVGKHSDPTYEQVVNHRSSW